MRVLVISDHADPLAPPGVGYHGGQNVYIKDLATHVASRSVSVDVLTRRDSERRPSVERIADHARVIRVTAGPYEPIPRDRFGDVLTAFTQVCLSVYDDADGYDVVHSHYWYSGMAGAQLAAQRHVAHAHSFLSLGVVRHAVARATGTPVDADQAVAREAAEQRLATVADALTAYCPVERAHLYRLLGAPVERIHVLPPGVDTTLLYPRDPVASRRSLDVAPDATVLLFVGRLEPRKGVCDLLQAFGLLRREFRDAVLFIVGGGGATDPQWCAVRQEVIRRGLQAAVRMVGSVPRSATARYYSAADVTVVPSHYEPFGLVAVDSLACGTPVVASRVGCLKWIVAGAGECARPRDPDDLASRTAKVLRNGRQSYLSRCTDLVAERFTIQRWAEGLVDLYRTLTRA